MPKGVYRRTEAHLVVLQSSLAKGRAAISKYLKSHQHWACGRKKTLDEIEHWRRSREGYHHSAATRKKISQAHKGRVRSAEHCRHISEAKSGKTCGTRNPFYGRTHTVKTRRKLSLLLSGRMGTFNGKHHSAYSKHLLGLSMVRRLSAGFVPHHQRSLYRKGGVKIWMRSSWEVKFAQWLDRIGTKWKYEPEWFRTQYGFYVPDFLLVDSDCYVEIKGQVIPKRMKKLNSFASLYGKSIWVLRYDNLRALGVL